MTKQIGSVITGLPKVSVKQTGEQRGVIGYGDLSSLPLPEKDRRPTELQTIIDDSVRRLVNLAFTKRIEGIAEDSSLSLDLIERGEQELTLALSAAQQALPPVTRPQIADALHTFAEMLQCSVPTPAGLKLYFHALQDMPYYKFQHACLELLKKHKWPRLPLPADFIEASKDVRLDVETFIASLKHAKITFEYARLERKKMLG
jgi:hypothetical protein